MPAKSFLEKFDRFIPESEQYDILSGITEYSLRVDKEKRIIEAVISMNRLIRTCKQMWPNNQGCITCKEGYYKSNNGKTFQKCDSSCKTCFN